MNQKITKRQFIKHSLLGAGAVGCGLCQASVYEGLNAFFNQGQGALTLNSAEDKFSIEALYYVSTPKGLKCLLCPNECKVKEGETSECRTRVNNNGILECIAYGNPCAIHIDPIEKKPLYHFLPTSRTYSIATAGCNLACLNCQNWEISQTSPLKTRNYELMPDQVVATCIENKCKSIAYTYTDPVVFYEYVLDSAKLAREENIRNIIVSAGYIYEKPLREWSKYIDAANIDLKSFSNELYEMLNAGKLDPVLDTLKILKDEGVWLEITNLIVPSWTDDFEMIKKMCGWLADNGFTGTPLHFSRFFPLYKLTDLPPTPIDTLKKAYQIAKSAGLLYVYIGNSPEIEGGRTICPDCKSVVVNRIGYTLETFTISNNRCTSCGTIIPGVWE